MADWWKQHYRECIEQTLLEFDIEVRSVVIDQLVANLLKLIENESIYKSPVDNSWMNLVNEQKQFRKQDKDNHEKELRNRDKYIKELEYTINNLNYKLTELMSK